MANVAKLLDIIYGANPSEDELRTLIERLNERLPKPEAPQVDTDSASSDEPKVSKAKSK